MLSLLLSGAGLAAILASACPQDPPTTARVIAHVEDITLGSSFSLAQLRDLAARSGRVPRHTPLGFYAADTRDTTTISVGNDRNDVCFGPVGVEVMVQLANRHIEVATDLQADACRYDIAVAHYQRHADADAAVVTRFIPILTEKFARAPLPSLVSAIGRSSPDNAEIVIAMKRIADPVLGEMGLAQRRAIEAIDTPEEISLLENSCGSGT